MLALKAIGSKPTLKIVLQCGQSICAPLYSLISGSPMLQVARSTRLRVLSHLGHLPWLNISVVHGMRSEWPNDPKLSDCGARRGSCGVRRSESIRARVKGGSDERRPDKK